MAAVPLLKPQRAGKMKTAVDSRYKHRKNQNWTWFQHQIKNNVAILLVRLSKKYFVTLIILPINRSSFEGNRKDIHKNFIFEHKVLSSFTNSGIISCVLHCAVVFILFLGRKYVGNFHYFANIISSLFLKLFFGQDILKHIWANCCFQDFCASIFSSRKWRL